MEYNIEYLSEAEKELSKLPKKHIQQILYKIDTLHHFKTITGVKKLKGNPKHELYRIRSGDYRIIFTSEEEKVIILIVCIAHRKDVYRKL
jgi:mRNA interferase RelE/StbE